MLLKAIKTQVETRLESSLHNRVYIIPSQDKNPNQVEHPWSIDVKSGSKPKVRLPQNTHIITVFDQEGVEGRLLILGQPGAGKTTMLLELAKKLVERAEDDLNEPIPILLSLASWRNDHQSIKDWIVAELNSGKYYKVRKDITLQWLEDGEIIPLLDGLDELAASRQESCVRKLNEFLQPGNWSCPLVICSRIKEYQLYPTQLALNTSVELQPFTPEQIQDYLTRTGNHQLGDSLRDDPTLSKLAQTPLLLNIIVISCQKLSLDKWQRLKFSEERLDYLFSTYVEVMLGRRYEHKQPSDEKTKHWLGWLADKLIEQNQTEFFIEKMQPAWLDNGMPIKIYRLSSGLIFGLGSALAVGLTDGRKEGLIFGLKVGLIFGLIFGLGIGLAELRNPIIKTFEIFHFRWKKFLMGMPIEDEKPPFSPILGLKGGLIGVLKGGLIDGLSVGLIVGPIVGLMYGLGFALKDRLKEGLIFGLGIGLMYGLFFGLIVGLIFGLMYGLFFGLIDGLIVGLIDGLDNSEIEIKTVPNQGIWKSLYNFVIIGLSVDLIFGLSFWLIGGLIGGLIRELISGASVIGRGGFLIQVLGVGLGVGLDFGLPIGLGTGGLACIMHFSLRLTLYRLGHIPWNYARFLNYATDRLFLQRVGGGYRFMHDLLRQHFATHYR